MSVEHPETADLELLGTCDNGLLRCRGCGACYLLLDGNPAVLRESLLDAAELKLLESRREQLSGL